MANLNRVLLIGNLTRDPDIRYTPKGTAVAEIGVAINRVTRDDDGQKHEDVTFVDVTLWGRLAEIAEKYLRKGGPVFVEGRLQLDSWEDKQTGQKRSRLRVVAENLQFLGAPATNGQGAKTKPAAAPAKATGNQTKSAAPAGSVPARQSKPAPAVNYNEDGEPDDIPF